MLQEAHLDHRIQLNFDEKNGGDEILRRRRDEEDEPPPKASPPPARGPVSSAAIAAAADAADGRGRPAGPPGQGKAARGPSRRSMQTSDLPIISDLLKPGQEILVQIAKEPIAKKGARITSTSRCPAASWSSCPPSPTSASAARSPPTRSASA
jgi:Ribonuclease G/E